MNPLEDAKMILLSAQKINTNEWYGAQFQKGLDDISVLLRSDDETVLNMRAVPQIILSLSEVCIMMNGQNKDKILEIQEALWKLHK